MIVTTEFYQFLVIIRQILGKYTNLFNDNQLTPEEL